MRAYNDSLGTKAKKYLSTFVQNKRQKVNIKTKLFKLKYARL